MNVQRALSPYNVICRTQDCFNIQIFLTYKYIYKYGPIEQKNLFHEFLCGLLTSYYNWQILRYVIHTTQELLKKYPENVRLNVVVIKTILVQCFPIPSNLAFFSMTITYQISSLLFKSTTHVP